MKLATLLLGILCTAAGVAGTASADDLLSPPGGPVYAEPAAPPEAAPGPARGERPRGDLRRGAGLRRGASPARAERGARARQLRRALVETFDVNGDGRLGPRERVRAARALRRIESRLAAAERGRAVRGAIRRYDVNGDGNVGPGELPPAGARRLRHLDRDGDGWIEPGEYR